MLSELDKTSYEQAALHAAILAARSVEGRTSPRPPVGAVVVQAGRIVGRGATAPPFGPHAEALALAEAGPAARGADLYVTLEPCCIAIHTPPCTDAILAAGVRRVIVGTLDPNPAVHTSGVQQLRQAGLEVIVLHDEECTELIRPFATFITRGRAHVTAKWAMTLDGKLATRTGSSAWVSGAESRQWVHDLRDRVDAILVGAGTARLDNPRLTVRLEPGQHAFERTARLQPPRRVVLATHGALPDTLALLHTTNEAQTWIVTGETCPEEQRQRLQAYGAVVLSAPLDEQGRVSIDETLRLLAEHGMMHVLLEGGAALLGSAFDRRCIDSVAVFIAPKLIGGSDAPSPLGGNGRELMTCACRLHRRRVSSLGDDLLIEGDVMYEEENDANI